ncbi:MAG: PG0541 family transporter-associated protein [Rikenellaceae bacterium]
MKAVFISYNQALTERVMTTLDQLQIRGFTKWALTEGRGSVDGEPHYGTHAWASMNSSMLVIVDDTIAKELLAALRAVDKSAPMQGLRAFMWSVEESV